MDSPEGYRRTGTDHKEMDAVLNLGARDRRIVALVMTGHNNKEIALDFSVSESTIYVRIGRISRKLGVRNKLELLLFAISHQI